ncbi:hypothetical protein PMN64_35255 [Bradyrhizobium sp. UFLA01-814]|uniref:hypothetical protein n=1 Tax=Bradyrhizobium sp. UFLA01-814 TaxID=3023480 RepID=UPI00398BB8CA
METTAKLLNLLERVRDTFSKCALKSLNNQTDFDSAIRRFDPSRPSHFYRIDLSGGFDGLFFILNAVAAAF